MKRPVEIASTASRQQVEEQYQRGEEEAHKDRRL